MARNDFSPGGGRWFRALTRPLSALGRRGEVPARQEAGKNGDCLLPAGPGMDAARWSNIAALGNDYAAGNQRLSAGPLEAYIEVAARCNLRCQMCPIVVDPRYDPHSGRPPLLTRELFARLEPLMPTLQRAYLFGLGEPLLNRDLFAFTERLATAGVEVWITTNATLVHDEQAEALAIAGLARVTVSIDGATAETYERIRRRGNFAHLLRGVKALAAARRRHGRPRLFFSMVAMASNVHELPRLVELCAELGGDGVHVEGLYDWPELEEVSRRENLNRLEPGRLEELLAQAQRRAAELGVEWHSRLDELALFAASLKVDAPPSAGVSGEAQMEAIIAAEVSGPAAAPTPAAAVLPWACSEPWATAAVNASGEVRTCCFNDQVFGDLNEQSFDNIWNGEAYQQLRADHIAGRVPASCSACVHQGRVKRSAFLAPRRPRGPVEPVDPVDTGAHPLARRVRLLAPADGELIAGPLVVVGKLPSPEPAWLQDREQPALRRGRPELPELHMDGSLLVRLRDYAMIADDLFAAVIAIPWVTRGAHRVSLAVPSVAGDTPGEPSSWDDRRLQIGLLSGETPDPNPYSPPEIPPAPATLTAVERLAFALSLDSPEPPPTLRLGGKRHPVAYWLCARHGDVWVGVAVVSVQTLAPGSYSLEVRLRHRAPFKRRLERLSAGGRPLPSGV